jgi:hypothetical protein
MARTKDTPTSIGPHHFGKASVFFEIPAIRGNAEDMTKTIAVTTARRRLHTGSAAEVFMTVQSKKLGCVHSPKKRTASI